MNKPSGDTSESGLATEKRRWHRRQVNEPCEAHFPEGVCRGVVLDISEGGALLQVSLSDEQIPLKAGDTFQLTIQELCEETVVIERFESSRLGISFATPLTEIFPVTPNHE